MSVLRRERDAWQAVARVATGGAEPCYIALDHDQRWLAAANYGSGSIAVFLLDARSGVPVVPAIVRANAGGGPVKDRQAGPHAHCVCFDRNRRQLYHVDLRTDEIIAYPLDAEAAPSARRASYSAVRPARVRAIWCSIRSCRLPYW